MQPRLRASRTVYPCVKGITPKVWLDRGWGLDALLGEQTRPHDDLDLAIPRGGIAGPVRLHAFAQVTTDPTLDIRSQQAGATCGRIGGREAVLRRGKRLPARGTEGHRAQLGRDWCGGG